MKAKLVEFLKELGEEILTTAPGKESKKAKLLNEIQQGLREVKNIQEGKSKSYSTSDLFDLK